MEPATALAMPAMSLTLREELECGEVEVEGEGEGEGEGELGKNSVPGWPRWP